MALQAMEPRPPFAGSAAVNGGGLIIVTRIGDWSRPRIRLSWNWGEGHVASRSAVPKIRIAGLERAARFAGESFAYEELSGFEARHDAETAQLRRLWWLAAGVALAGLALVALR